MKGGESDEDQQISEAIMSGWELVSLSKDGVDLKFNFTNPLKVSSDEEPDLLLV